MQDLVNNPPEGIKVQINEEDVTDIQAFIEGPAGKSFTYNLHSDLKFNYTYSAIILVFVQSICYSLLHCMHKLLKLPLKVS